MTTTHVLDTLITLPLGDVAQGTDYIFPKPVNRPNGWVVPPGLSTWLLSLDATNMDPLSHIEFRIEWSFDGGTTWVILVGNGGGGFEGGLFDKKNPDGSFSPSGVHVFGAPDQVQQNPYPTNVRIHVRIVSGVAAVLQNIAFITTP